MRPNNTHTVLQSICLIVIAIACSVTALATLYAQRRPAYEIGYAFIPDGDNGETIDPLADDGWQVVHAQREADSNGRLGLTLLMQRRK